MPHFSWLGANIFYEVIGVGEPVLLIAGIASDSASWGPLLPELADRQVILIDNRGSGRTKVDGEITISEMCSDCAALLRHLGIGRADVVGHSMGGLIGLMLAADHPDVVRRLVTLAIGTFGEKEKVLFRDLSRLYFDTSPEDWFRLLFQFLFSEPFFSDSARIEASAQASVAYPFRQSPADFARQVEAVDDVAMPDLAAVSCPTLAVSAADDVLAPDQKVKELHAPIPDVRFELIEDAAHSVHWEQPEAVGAAIRAFIA